MTLKYIWRSFSLGCYFHDHFSYPWHAFASHGLPAIAELLVNLAVMRHRDAGASCVNSEKNFLSALWPWAYFTNGPRQRLLSASSMSLAVRRTRLSTVGDRAFPIASTRLWNSLPSHITTAPSLSTFRSRLNKSYFFFLLYPNYWLFFTCSARAVKPCHFGNFNRFHIYVFTFTVDDISDVHVPLPFIIIIPTYRLSSYGRRAFSVVDPIMWTACTRLTFSSSCMRVCAHFWR